MKLDLIFIMFDWLKKNVLSPVKKKFKKWFGGNSKESEPQNECEKLEKGRIKYKVECCCASEYFKAAPQRLKKLQLKIFHDKLEYGNVRIFYQMHGPALEKELTTRVVIGFHDVEVSNMMGDQNWDDFQEKYQTEDLVTFFALTPPVMSPDGWEIPEIYNIIDEFIDFMNMKKYVDPDKISLRGRGKGGILALKICCAMPYRFASVFIVDADLSQIHFRNMSNLPLAVHYYKEYIEKKNLAKSIETFLKRLTSYKGDDKDIYPYTLSMSDSIAQARVTLRWALKQVRNPYPARIEWEFVDYFASHFYYYMSVPQESYKPGTHISAIYKKEENLFKLRIPKGVSIVVYTNQLMLAKGGEYSVECPPDRKVHKKIDLSEGIIPATALFAPDMYFVFMSYVEL